MSPTDPEAYAWPDYTDLVGRIRELEATLSRVRSLVDEATGYSVPYKRSRFMPIDSSFTNALKATLGVPHGHACVGYSGVVR